MGLGFWDGTREEEGKGVKRPELVFFLFCKAGSVHFWNGSEANSTHSSVPGNFHCFSRMFGHFFENIQNLQNKINQIKTLKI